MERNEAGWDRTVRVLVGLAALATVVAGPQSPWGLIGLVPIATGLSGYCPLYRLVGFSTCRSAGGRS